MTCTNEADSGIKIPHEDWKRKGRALRPFLISMLTSILPTQKNSHAFAAKFS